MDRRRFLATTAAAGAALLWPGTWRHALAGGTRPGAGPYGPLLAPDANGIALPEGFTSRVVGTSGQTVTGTGYAWHPNPDGGATFADGDGWIYVSNSEVPGIGGVGVLRFDADAEIIDAYRILDGTTQNCAGGPTPWGTWLSCEEHPGGRVWECDPTRAGQGEERPALGTFAHEAVAVDPDDGRLYLTEDGPAEGDGFYRFTPAVELPDLGDGTLEVAAVDGDGAVTWIEVDPLVPMDEQRPAGMTGFAGAEGIWFANGHVWFTTKGDGRVWDLDVASQRVTVIYDAVALGEEAPLTGVDNLTVSSHGDLYVAEDGGNMELVVISTEGEVAPLLRIDGHETSEVTGPAFDPSERRLYLSSQRGPGIGTGGVTYEISGPFRRSEPVAPSTTVASAASSGDDGSEVPLAIPLGAGVIAAGAGAAWWLRRRAAEPPSSEDPSR